VIPSIRALSAPADKRRMRVVTTAKLNLSRARAQRRFEKKRATSTSVHVQWWFTAPRDQNQMETNTWKMFAFSL
jgi:hypothetical protein